MAPSPPPYVYPLGVQGSIHGGPYQGSHSKSFNKANGSDNWESENAIDIYVPIGTPVYAVADGTIGSQIGSLNSSSPRMAGLRLHLVTNGNEFYYTHLSKLSVHAGEHVVAGQLLGYSGEANGVEHLHIASKTGNPLDLLSKAPMSDPSNTPPPVDQSGATTSPPPDNGTQAAVATNQQAQNDYQSQIDAINASLGNTPPIPQIGTTAGISGPALAGDFLMTNQSPAAPMSSGGAASTWQLIASNGQVSQDTIRLAGLAGYMGSNGGN